MSSRLRKLEKALWRRNRARLKRQRNGNHAGPEARKLWAGGWRPGRFGGGDER